MSSTSVMWFRRDLRLADNPALAAACAAAETVLPVFVVDPVLWDAAGEPRRSYLASSLNALSASMQGALVVRRGDPVTVVPAVAAEVGAESVHVSADFGPYGAKRDQSVEAALADQEVRLERVGSPYAVDPGQVLNGSGEGYQVFTAYYRAWLSQGWHGPADAPSASWASARSDQLPEAGQRAGETVAGARWRDFLDQVDDYASDRDIPALDGTSRMSAHLKWGEIHPRTMLADLADRSTDGAATYRKELAWRDFYADVLARRPETARGYYSPAFARMEYDEPGEQLEAWREGRTGYPLVDAGMRQLRETGWMHNRLRMVVASFLVKDLHLEWTHGARHFMQSLVDGDLASNQHGWQWVAGCGTDAAPYFRIFNPTAQSRRFDPAGEYIRRWVPELAHLPAKQIHAPGEVEGYPPPMVDHARERAEALRRLEQLRRG